MLQFHKKINDKCVGWLLSGAGNIQRNNNYQYSISANKILKFDLKKFSIGLNLVGSQPTHMSIISKFVNIVSRLF